MSPCELVIWFTLASVAGWLFESVYSIVRTGRWEKRGFLFGPMCPIYGVGVVAALLLFDRPEVADGAFPIWAVFLCSMAGSAVMEYVVSYTLEKLFGAVWWDYSDLPLNLNGRICLPASLLFGAAGTVIAYVAMPIIHMVDASVPYIVFELGALGSVFLLGLDLSATVLSLSDLMGIIVSMSEEANSRANARVQQAGAAVRSLPGRAQAGGEKARARIAFQQERLRSAMGRLTARQVKLLSQLKRFSSQDVRDNATALLEAVRNAGQRGDRE